MIDINLVPSKLRKKKKSPLLGKFNIPLEVIIGCGGGLLFLLGIIHVVLLFVNIGKLAQHKNLQKQWEALRPDKESVDSLINEMRTLQGKQKAIEEILQKGGISWARELNILSDSLSRGVWLRKVAFNDDMLFIEGSAISKDTTEIISIHRLTSDLKANEKFSDHFSDIELGSIQRRRIKNVEIAEFVITMKIK